MLAHVEALAPDVLAVDSIQAVSDPDLAGRPGIGHAGARVRAPARAAREGARGVTTLLVGHVTKDGHLAGPRTLEHVVDTVLSFDGDRHHALRFLHALKHRFGSTQELGLLEMTEATGSSTSPIPSALFLADRRAGAPGSVVDAGRRGRASAARRGAGPRRARDGGADARAGAATGVDAARLALLLAVLQQRAGVLDLGGRDVYASVAGGVRVAEPGADLAVALAVAGARAESGARRPARS